jgi:glycosyltransferase involved in cell wall biosynthesis
MQIVVAHEWLVRYAGSERVVDEMLVAFPGAELLTTVIDPPALPPRLRGARPSLLQRIPGATRHHEWLLPLMPLAWRLRTPIVDADAVISSSHACAKAVRIGAGIPHLCYCHTPMRYAWDFESERERFPRAIRPAARLAMAWFRDWDRRASRNVDVFVANSTSVRERIAVYYGRAARVIHPPVRTDRFTPGGARGDAFLYVGRLVPYKRADLAVEAFAGLEQRLIVVGEGQLGPRLEARATPNISFLGDVDEEKLLELYRTARALVFPAEEDFGIAMAEAQACGTPVIGLNRGGARDIVQHDVTGWLIDAPTVDRVRQAVRRATEEELDPAEIRRQAERFSSGRFRAEMAAAVEAMVEVAKAPAGFEQLRRFGLE